MFYDYVSIFEVQDNLLSDLYRWEVFIGEYGDILVQLTDEDDLLVKYVGDDLITSPIHPGIKRVISRIVPNMQYVGDVDDLRGAVPIEYVEHAKITIAHYVTEKQVRLVLSELLDKGFAEIESDDQLKVFNGWSTRWERGFYDGSHCDEFVDEVPSTVLVLQGLDERDNPPVFAEVFLLKEVI